LVARRSQGVHGYQLYGDFEAISEDFWQLNYGKLYRVLDSLAAGGDLEVANEIQSKHPNRKVHRITERGRRSLDDWLMQPLSDEPRPMRDELSLKLLFIETCRFEQVGELISQQRGIYLDRMSRLERRRRRLKKAGIAMEVVALVMDGAVMRVRADLAWLDHIERRIIRGL